jgi:hypothetical protein
MRENGHAPGFPLPDRAWKRRLHQGIDRFLRPETGLNTAPHPLKDFANLFAIDRLRLHVPIACIGQPQDASQPGFECRPAAGNIVSVQNPADYDGDRVVYDEHGCIFPEDVCQKPFHAFRREQADTAVVPQACGTEQILLFRRQEQVMCNEFGNRGSAPAVGQDRHRGRRDGCGLEVGLHDR